MLSENTFWFLNFLQKQKSLSGLNVLILLILIPVISYITIVLIASLTFFLVSMVMTKEVLLGFGERLSNYFVFTSLVEEALSQLETISDVV